MLQLTISLPLTEEEAAQLQAFIGETVQSAAPAPKAKPAPKATAKAAPVAEEAPEVPDEPADEADAEEDLLGGAPTLEDAVAKATELVSSGQTATVKAALAAVGAKRVSEVKANQVQAFIDALDV